MGQMGKWPYGCTTTDLDNAVEIPTEEIHLVVRSANSRPHWCHIWHVSDQVASPYEGKQANDQKLHNHKYWQLHKI